MMKRSGEKEEADLIDEEPRCPHMENCAMYELFAFESSLSLWKKNYCTADYARCARYQLSREGQSVPLELLPNGQHLRRAP